jgi:hypothetical protein
MMQISQRLGAVAFLLVAAAPEALRAETVYEFAVNCRKEQLARCFSLITERLNILKAKGQGHAFCLPRAWGNPDFMASGYPVSFLEHVRLSLSAARFGNAEAPVEDALRDIVRGVYPCD